MKMTAKRMLLVASMLALTTVAAFAQTTQDSNNGLFKAPEPVMPVSLKFMPSERKDEIGRLVIAYDFSKAVGLVEIRGIFIPGNLREAKKIRVLVCSDELTERKKQISVDQKDITNRKLEGTDVIAIDLTNALKKVSNTGRLIVMVGIHKDVRVIRPPDESSAACALFWPLPMAPKAPSYAPFLLAYPLVAQ